MGAGIGQLDTAALRRLDAWMSEGLFIAAGKRGVTVPPPPHTPEVLGNLAASIFLHPMRETRKTPRELAYLQNARSFKLRTSAGELAAWEWGEPGRPLVGLLHGWEGHGAQLGAFAAPLVAAGFRVLTFDAPGHGDSPGDECSAPLVGRLVVAMEPQVGPFFALVAHSMGAAAAAMAASAQCARTAAVRSPQIRGMVFLAPPLSQLDRVARTANRMQLAPGVRAAFEAAIVRRTGLRFEEADMHHVAKLAPCPLLALHDPEDRDTDYVATEQFVARWRGAKLIPCPGRGHFRILSTPEVVRQGLEFIAGLPR